MQIRPIRSERDHERAVARISELMSARSGTAEGDELDVLATLVDAYEAKHHAIDGCATQYPCVDSLRGGTR